MTIHSADNGYTEFITKNLFVFYILKHILKHIF